MSIEELFREEYLKRKLLWRFSKRL